LSSQHRLNAFLLSFLRKVPYTRFKKEISFVKYRSGCEKA